MTRPALPPRLHVEMAPATGAWLRRAQCGMAAAAAVASLAALWWWQQSLMVAAAALQVEAAASQLEAANQRTREAMARDGATATGEQVARVKRQVAFANLLAAKRSFSWAQLLGDLDDALPAGVSLISIQMDFKTSRVALQGSVWSLQDLNAVIQSLGRHAAFKNATVIDHRAEEGRESLVSEGGGSDRRHAEPERPVQFQLSVTYRPSSGNGR
jgi:hypothetical protein